MRLFASLYFSVKGCQPEPVEGNLFRLAAIIFKALSGNLQLTYYCYMKLLKPYSQRHFIHKV